MKNIFQRLLLCFELFAIQTLPLYLCKVGTGLSTHLDILEEDWQLISLRKNIHYVAVMAILQGKKKKLIFVKRYIQTFSLTRYRNASV